MSTSDNSNQKYKDFKQRNLADYGFISYCALPRQTKLDKHIPKNSPILDILFKCKAEEEKAKKKEDAE